MGLDPDLKITIRGEVWEEISGALTENETKIKNVRLLIVGLENM